MTSQFAKIGMQQTLSKLYIEQQHADLSIEQPKATITMETTPSQLTIDQMAAWEQMNLKSTRKTIEEFAQDRKSTRLNSSHVAISYAVFCLKKKKETSNWYPCYDCGR